eukprot:COSAG04_NODE_915_length_9438_cov_28.362351_6_plen_136_part_00
MRLHVPSFTQTAHARRRALPPGGRARIAPASPPPPHAERQRCRPARSRSHPGRRRAARLDPLLDGGVAGRAAHDGAARRAARLQEACARSATIGEASDGEGAPLMVGGGGGERERQVGGRGSEGSALWNSSLFTS